jgi:hypothetical protein
VKAPEGHKKAMFQKKKGNFLFYFLFIFWRREGGRGKNNNLCPGRARIFAWVKGIS